MSQQAPLTDQGGSLRELRLRYSVEGMATVIDQIDHMHLGVLPQELAIFLVHASNAANWHDSDKEASE